MLEIGQKLEGDPSARPTKEEQTLLRRLLAAAEAWLDYAVLRHAFRLAGLKASGSPGRRPSPPLTNLAFGSRAKLYLTRFYELEAYARARAARLRQTLAQADGDDDFQTSTSIRRIWNLTPVRIANPNPKNFSRRPIDGEFDEFRFHAAIRGPPSIPSSCRHARLAQRGRGRLWMGPAHHSSSGIAYFAVTPSAFSTAFADSRKASPSSIAWPWIPPPMNSASIP